MEKVAQNEGSGSDLRNAAMGIGMGFGVGGAFGDALTNISNNTMMSSLTDPMAPPAQADSMGGGIPGMIDLRDTTATAPAKAQQREESAEDEMTLFKRKLDKLVMMKDAGILTDEEFAEQKNELIAEIKRK